jgi:ankyrin repeat protein
MESLLCKAVKEGNEGEVARLLDEDPALLEKTGHGGWTPLLLATGHGQLRVMQLLIQRGANASPANISGDTALHVAAWGGQEQAAAFLLGQGAQSTNKNVGTTPFMLACERRHLGVARLLLQRLGKQELQATDNGGQTALHVAASCGNEEIISFLLGQGAQANSKDEDGATPLMMACEEGQTGVVKVLLQHVGPEALQETNEHGLTALHYAAMWGHEATVTFLLGEGAQANSKDKVGTTSFMMACEEGHMGVVKVLLQHVGAQAFQATDEDGQTALHAAAGCGNEEIVSFLLGQGAQANSRDEDGATPLMMACEEGQTGVVKVLLQHVGPEALQETNEHGLTALHYAAMCGLEETATFLLGQGAQANSKDKKGITTLMMACAKGGLGVVGLLLQHIGPEALQERDENGRVALHWACKKARGEVVRALLIGGADPTVTDNEGRTPRAIAEEEEEEEEEEEGEEEDDEEGGEEKEEKRSRAGCVAAFEVRKSDVLAHTSLVWPAYIPSP